MKFLSNLSIRKKLFMLVAFLMVSLVAIQIFTIYKNDTMWVNMQTTIYDQGFEASQLILNADRDMYQALSAADIVILSKNQKEVEDNLKVFDENVQQVKDRTKNARELLEKNMGEWEKYKSKDTGKNMFEHFSLLNTEFDNWVNNTRMEIESRGMPEQKGAQNRLDLFNTQRNNIDVIGATLQEAMEANSNVYYKDFMNNGYIMLGLLAFFLIILLFVTFIITGNITKPLADVVEMIQEMGKGHLRKRLRIQRKDEIGVLAKTMDNFADDLQKNVVGTMNKVAEGDFNIDIKEKDDDDEIIPAINKTVSSVKGLIKEVDGLTRAAVEGNLTVRGITDNFKGGYREIISGVNKTLDSILEPVKEASEVLGEMSKGNLQVKVEGNYRGGHAEIKNALNETIEALKNYIDEISSILTEISEGNLDISVTGDYRGDFIEIKDSLNHIINSFNSVLGNMVNASQQVASASRQISDSAQTLSQSTTEQASSIEELTTTMESVAEKTKKNAISANQANEFSTAAKDYALNGNEQMKAMLVSMDDINKASSDISKIIKVIDEIAFQTNILALNAAVEAARAGQHGKGFAVVAEEVRNLAARSAQAAKETTTLIEGSIKKVNDGTRIANDTAEALNKIVEGVSKAAELVGDIASESNEQATGISQINVGISQVSQVVQTNSATSQESAAASEELSSQAEMLNEMVRKFKIRKNTAFQADMRNREPEVMSLPEYSNTNKREKHPHTGNGNLKSEKRNIALSDTEYDKY